MPVLHWACDARGGQGGRDRKKQGGTQGGGARKKQGGTQGGGARKKKGGTQGGGARKKQGRTPVEYLESEFLSRCSHGFARWPSRPLTSGSPLVMDGNIPPSRLSVGKRIDNGAL